MAKWCRTSSSEPDSCRSGTRRIIRLAGRVAAALEDGRDPALSEGSILTMVRQRIYGILADYEDQNEHETLRRDPVFKLIADRFHDGPHLASRRRSLLRERRVDPRPLAAPRRHGQPVHPIIR